MLRSLTAGEERLLPSGEPAVTAQYFSRLSLFLYSVFQTVNTHPLIKARRLFSVRGHGCCEAARHGVLPHRMCPTALVMPQSHME